MAEQFRDQSGTGRSVLRRQHLPLHAGGFRGVGAARPYPFSAVGYQPTLATDMGAMQERITSTKQGLDHLDPGHLRAADDLTDPAPATTFAHLDATTVLNRAISELGIYPAVDPLDSTSRLMDPQIVGEEHYEGRPRRAGILQRYKSLQDIIAILGMDELSEEDKLTDVFGLAESCPRLVVSQRHHLHRAGRALRIWPPFDGQVTARACRGSLYRADDDLWLAFGTEPRSTMSRPCWGWHCWSADTGHSQALQRAPIAMVIGGLARAGEVHRRATMRFLRALGACGGSTAGARRWRSCPAIGIAFAVLGLAPHASRRAVLFRRRRMGPILVRQFRQFLSARARPHGAVCRTAYALRDAAGRALWPGFYASLRMTPRRSAELSVLLRPCSRLRSPPSFCRRPSMPITSPRWSPGYCWSPCPSFDRQGPASGSCRLAAATIGLHRVALSARSLRSFAEPPRSDGWTGRRDPAACR